MLAGSALNGIIGWSALGKYKARTNVFERRPFAPSEAGCPHAAQLMLQINKKSIVRNNVEVARFPYEIGEHRVLEDVLVMVIDRPPGVEYRSNAFGYDLKRDILWQLDNASNECSVVGILDKVEPGVVFLYTWEGVEFRVDLATGKILSMLDTR